MKPVELTWNVLRAVSLAVVLLCSGLANDASAQPCMAIGECDAMDELAVIRDRIAQFDGVTEVSTRQILSTSRS